MWKELKEKARKKLREENQTIAGDINLIAGDINMIGVNPPIAPTIDDEKLREREEKKKKHIVSNEKMKNEIVFIYTMYHAD